MEKTKNNDMTNSSYWNEKWKEIFSSYQGDLRHAYYINSLRNSDEYKILEIAAGSFRDMAKLRKMGVDCHGMDFSETSVNKAKQEFKEFKEKIFQSDAFNTNFIDKSYDLTYHNGFWNCFQEDEIILRLANEQARISKKRMIATVHNAHNENFKKYFEKKKIDDSLFDLRFFSIDEMHYLLEKTCKDIKIFPVGKGKKTHEDFLIKSGLTNRVLLRSYLKVSSHHYLKNSERLLCIGTPRD